MDMTKRTLMSAVAATAAGAAAFTLPPDKALAVDAPRLPTGSDANESWARGKQLIHENKEVLASFRLRTVTMGLNLLGAIDSDPAKMKAAVNARLTAELPVFNQAITDVLDDLSKELSLNAEDLLQTRRAAITPIETMVRSMVQANGGNTAATRRLIVDFASFVDKRVSELIVLPAKSGQGVFLGGAGILAERGLSSEQEAYLAALPEVLKNTSTFNVDFSVGSTRSGIFLDSVRAAARVTRQVGRADMEYTKQMIPNPDDPSTWKITPEQMDAYTISKKSIQSAHPNAHVYPYFSNLARMAVFANPPQENPFMAGGFSGLSAPSRTVSIGVNGAGVMQKAILATRSNSINDILQSVKHYSGIMYEVAERVRFEVIRRMTDKKVAIGEADGIVDLSIAATNDRDAQGKPTNSVASALAALGVQAGAYGSVAAVGMLIDAIKKAGSARTTYAGGLSGTFIPISEDAGMADAVAAGWLTYPRFLSMTAVCSVGTDMFFAHWPASVSDEAFEAQVAGMLLDEMAIGVYTNKTTSSRILPVPYAYDPNRWVVLMGGGGLLGNAPVMDMQFSELPPPSVFINRLGALPAPLTSFRN